MALDKREIRREIAPLVGDFGVQGLVTTTAEGNANGLTFVTSQFRGYGADYFRNCWALPTSGTEEGKHREIEDFDGTTPASSSTFTQKGAAWSAAVANAVTIELYKFNPSLYTTAINKAISSIYPLVHAANLDSSLTWTAGTFSYTLPSGITPEMVKKVMIEGTGSFDNLPWWNVENYTFNPAATLIQFNRQELSRVYDFTTTRIIYIFSEKYLTEVAVDTQGAIATDTTDLVELTKTTNAWRLFLRYCVAEMLELIDAPPEKIDKAWADAHAWDSRLRMRPVESTYSWSY